MATEMKADGYNDILVGVAFPRASVLPLIYSGRSLADSGEAAWCAEQAGQTNEHVQNCKGVTLLTLVAVHHIIGPRREAPGEPITVQGVLEASTSRVSTRLRGKSCAVLIGTDRIRSSTYASRMAARLSLTLGRCNTPSWLTV